MKEKKDESEFGQFREKDTFRSRGDGNDHPHAKQRLEL